MTCSIPASQPTNRDGLGSVGKTQKLATGRPTLSDTALLGALVTEMVRANRLRFPTAKVLGVCISLVPYPW